MDSGRSLQVVFPWFFQGLPEKGPQGVPKATQGVPTASQSVLIASQGVPKASPGLPKDSPRPSQGVSKHGQLILWRRWSQPSDLSWYSPQSRKTYQERPSRITYQARPSSCLRPLGLFQFGASVELSRQVLSFKTIYSIVPSRCFWLAVPS